MIRTLLAGTALAVLLSNAAFAQDASSSMPMNSSMMSSEMPSSMMDSSAMADSSSMMADSSSMMADSSSMMADSSMAPDSSSLMDSSMMDDDTSSAADAAPMARTPVVLAEGYTKVDTDRLATKIIGSPVYASGAKDAENFGNITDLVLDANGQIAAVVLGVGGFLGIGEKQVAVDFSALQWVVADDNTERFTLQTTKDELTSAPDFTTVDDQPAAANSAMAPADSAAPAATMTPAAPADTSAMAPAGTMSSSAAQ